MKIVPVPCSFDNYSYLLICKDTHRAAVVDPTEAHPVLAEIEKNNAQLTTVLCTHHHQDHIGDIGQLLEQLPTLTVVCHISDKNRIGVANSYVEEGDTVEVGKLRGSVLFTPGHTSGSICYQFQDHLFVGDTLFGAGCGRLFEGSPEQMYTSLQKIAALRDETKIYFGHEYTRTNLNFAKMVETDNEKIHDRLHQLSPGEEFSTPTTLQLEKETNPFLRCNSKLIHSFLETRKESTTTDPLGVFTILRQLRNNF
jgi:hydroxyacylglutathione hydrolase